MTESERHLHDRFLRLFMEHEDSLRVYLRSLLFSKEEMREVMQEVAVVLWKKFDEEMDSLSFRKWAFGVARMEVLAFRRDRARDRLCFGEEVFDLLTTSNMEEAERLAAERQALDTCLEKLPDQDRKLLEAAYTPEVRVDVLAERLGRTAMSLYKKIHRIRLILVDCTRQELARESS